MACRQRNYLITPAVEDWIGADQDRSSPKSGKGRERGMSAAAKKGTSARPDGSSILKLS
jgi:hypothetical protein